MSLGTTYSSTVPVGWATNFDQCLHIVMVIGKCTCVFRRIFWLGEGLKRGGYTGGTSIEEFVMGEENFHEGSAGFTSIIKKKKNNEKINMKKFFSAGSKEQH